LGEEGGGSGAGAPLARGRSGGMQRKGQRRGGAVAAGAGRLILLFFNKQHR